MASGRNLREHFAAVVVVTAAMLTLLTMTSAQDNGKREAGEGKYGQLTAQWWQWILEQPQKGNPLLDTTGADAGNGQPRVDVFFLAGTPSGTATRHITVPAGEALFF